MFVCKVFFFILDNETNSRSHRLKTPAVNISFKHWDVKSIGVFFSLKNQMNKWLEIPFSCTMITIPIINPPKSTEQLLVSSILFWSNLKADKLKNAETCLERFITIFIPFAFIWESCLRLFSSLNSNVFIDAVLRMKCETHTYQEIQRDGTKSKCVLRTSVSSRTFPISDVSVHGQSVVVYYG